MLTEPLLPPASTCAESSASATGTATSSRGCLAPVGESSASSASAAAPAALGFSSTASGFSGASGSGCSNPAEPSGLRSSPSWLFSARKLLQRQDQQLAAQRLLRQAQTAGGGSSSSGGSGTGQHNKTAQPRLAVVAGEKGGRRCDLEGVLSASELVRSLCRLSPSALSDHVAVLAVVCARARSHHNCSEHAHNLPPTTSCCRLVCCTLPAARAACVFVAPTTRCVPQHVAAAL